uniref:Uncharacterized protein n=1 Tax=Serratia marcescens TaxID=615 RepID=A0A1C3HHL3_SERMA|nr:Uncharacterised protein [Serratia marcescens]
MSAAKEKQLATAKEETPAAVELREQVRFIAELQLTGVTDWVTSRANWETLLARADKQLLPQALALGLCRILKDLQQGVHSQSLPFPSIE